MPKLSPTIHDDLDLPEKWSELSKNNEHIHALVDEYKRLGTRQALEMTHFEKKMVFECKKRIRARITNLLNK